MICPIFMALRAIYFQAILLRDPVYSVRVLDALLKLCQLSSSAGLLDIFPSGARPRWTGNKWQMANNEIFQLCCGLKIKIFNGGPIKSCVHCFLKIEISSGATLRQFNLSLSKPPCDHISVAGDNSHTITLPHPDTNNMSPTTVCSCS